MFLLRNMAERLALDDTNKKLLIFYVHLSRETRRKRSLYRWKFQTVHNVYDIIHAGIHSRINIPQVEKRRQRTHVINT